MKAVILLALVLSLTTVLAAWAYILAYSDKDVPDPKFLASDLFFRLNEFSISVPAVAVRDVGVPPKNKNPLPRYRFNARFVGESRWFATGEYKVALLNFAGNPETPANVSSISLNFGVYGTYGEYTVSQQICPLLTKEWSQKACINKLRNEQMNLPIGFSLTTNSVLPTERMNTVSTIPNVSSPEIKLVCEEGLKRCNAAIEISKSIFATWSSSCGDTTEEACNQKRRAEGNAVSEFLRNQLRIHK